MTPSETELLHRGGPAASWGNLGLWPAPDYASACTALADTVAHAAGLRRGDRVLSPGCGAGEELRHWIGACGASLALGLEPDSSIIEAPDLPPGAQRRTTSALDNGDWLTPESSGRFDVILCVDAVYHCSPRQRWLQQARQWLRPGGRIAFTDLTLHSQWLPTAAIRGVLNPAARAARINLHDVLSRPAAGQRLLEAGFCEVQATPLDAAVLDGFTRFVGHQSQALGKDRQAPGWRRVARTATLLRLARPLGLGYALFSATAAT